MAHGYRTLQRWNQWLSQPFLGSNLLEAEQRLLSRLLNRHFGRQALLIGVPNQHSLLKSVDTACHSLVSPLFHKEGHVNYIEGDFQELPILTGSVDVVMLPHALEFIDNPRQVLSEACRVVRPEGLIVVCGFNSYSAWGMRRALLVRRPPPWAGRWIHAHRIKHWLQLADFAMEKRAFGLFRPPVTYPGIYRRLQFLERVGHRCFPLLGGVYVLVARAKVIPLTPIRLKWKQQLSGIRISTSIPGHIAREVNHCRMGFVENIA